MEPGETRQTGRDRKVGGACLRGWAGWAEEACLGPWCRASRVAGVSWRVDKAG